MVISVKLDIALLLNRYFHEQLGDKKTKKCLFHLHHFCTKVNNAKAPQRFSSRVLLSSHVIGWCQVSSEGELRGATNPTTLDSSILHCFTFITYFYNTPQLYKIQ